MDNKLGELSKPAWIVGEKEIADFMRGEEALLVRGHDPESTEPAMRMYSQEYVSALLAERDSNQQNYQNAMEELRIERSQRQAADQRIAELETQVNVWESAAMKHLARAEEAEKRLPILEQDKLRLNEIINSEANRADAAEKLLATPVRLPEGTGWASDPYNHGRNGGINECAGAIRAAGFNVQGDE